MVILQAKLWSNNIVLILLFTALSLQLMEMSFKELGSLHLWLDVFLVQLFETLNLYKKKKTVNSLMLSRFRMASCYNWHVRKKSLTAQSTFDTSAVMVEIKIIQWIIFFADYSISDYRNMIENTYQYRNDVLRVIYDLLKKLIDLTFEVYLNSMK